MITRRTLAAGLAAALFAILAVASAQAEDDVLERYRLATDSLLQAQATFAEDAVAARTELDRAFNALLSLARGGSQPLAASLDRVFERARTAIDNRSATDFAVQTSVLHGGFRRILYESALTAGVEGRTDTARQRLVALASDMALGSAREEQIRNAADLASLRQAFEAGVAERVGAALDALAAEGTPESTDSAYRRLSGAYADLVVVQDSRRLDPAAPGRFVTAAQALVGGDTDGYLAAVRAVASDMNALRDAADAGDPGRPAEEEPVVAEAPADPAPADPAPADPAPAEPDPAQTDPAEAAEPAEPAEAPEPTPAEAQEPTAEDAEAAAAEAAAATDEPLPEGAELAALREQITSEIEAARSEAERASLQNELAQVGVPEGVRTTLAQELHTGGVRSVTDLERDLAARVARLQAELHAGRNETAASQLALLAEAYEVGLGRVMQRIAPDEHLAYSDLLVRTADSPVLRNQQVTLLASATSKLSDRLRVPRPDLVHDLSTVVNETWAGWIRAAVLIVVALLALLPLRLLRLAFGSGNRNWGMVGSALFLLLLPLWVEALIALGGLLAGAIGMPILAAGTSFSIFASEASYAAWLLLTTLAVLLATFGFYGICRQFGVLGRSKSPAKATAATKTGASTRSGAKTKADKDETLVDWDDEY